MTRLDQPIRTSFAASRHRATRHRVVLIEASRFSNAAVNGLGARSDAVIAISRSQAIVAHANTTHPASALDRPPVVHLPGGVRRRCPARRGPDGHGAGPDP